MFGGGIFCAEKKKALNARKSGNVEEFGREKRNET